MENTVKQRLMEFCKATGIRPSHIEQKCGFSHGYVNGNNDQNGGKVIDVLSAQLDEKDRQINKLLNIIENLSK